MASALLKGHGGFFLQDHHIEMCSHKSTGRPRRVFHRIPALWYIIFGSGTIEPLAVVGCQHFEPRWGHTRHFSELGGVVVDTAVFHAISNLH